AWKVPDTLAGRRTEREQRIGKQTVSKAVTAVKIKRGRTGRRIDNPAHGIERHSSPIIRRAARFPRIGRPRLVAELARMRNRVEGPSQFAGPDVEAANVSRRRRKRLRIPPAGNEQV